MMIKRCDEVPLLTGYDSFCVRVIVFLQLGFQLKEFSHANT